MLSWLANELEMMQDIVIVSECLILSEQLSGRNNENIKPFNQDLDVNLRILTNFIL
jgi:hypothetical protein